MISEMSKSVPLGTVRCILCRGMVPYRNLNNSLFVKHMEKEHGSYYDLEFILATCFMDEEEKKAVTGVIEVKLMEEKDKQNKASEIKKEPVEVLSIKQETLSTTK